ncbi:unnamed protein product [Plutella xylostella]|uniref:Mitochondrial genome maintenance exonuclease 1 n=1 Tax=Plutella xylostella TaxID=51655 RepID=A0A8S4DGN8_PLUXY|nr:unnamed protein product [Plutella xylostella]
MFRSVCTIGRFSAGPPKDFVRTKVIKVVKSASILKPIDRLKLWHKENKELFGPLLETSKQKKQRLKKAAKNSKKSRQNNSSGATVENTSGEVKFSANNPKYTPSCVVKYHPVLPMEILKRSLWQNSKPCVNFVSVLLSRNAVRGVKTSAVCGSTKSSPLQPGYASEDKILQIKQHQNDYAKQFPSVTLILNKTMTGESMANLEKWKKEKIAEVGEEEFKRFYEAQMAVGSKFHTTLKNYFTQPQSQLRIEKDVEGVWNSVGNVLKSISSPKAIESNVVHPVLKYRGIFDAIADYEDKPTLIEWKKSDKPRKSIALTYDNPVQLAAYFGAVCNDLNYKHFNIRDALLVIAYTDGSKADAYHFSTDRLREHWAQWLIRLETYMKQHGSDAVKSLRGGKRLFEEDVGNLQ